MLRNNCLKWDWLQVVEQQFRDLTQLRCTWKSSLLFKTFFIIIIIFLTLKMPFGWFTNKNLKITAIRKTAQISVFHYFVLIFILI